MIFDKELNQITEGDLQELVDNRLEESLILDFKRELTGNKGIAQDVSSMANAKGGLLIYGIDEDDSHHASKLVGIPAEDAKERVENVVLSSIQPKLEISIKPVELTTDRTKTTLVLRIPESSRGPHMVTVDHDYRYYRRRNFQALVMEESEVRELYDHMADMSGKVDRFLASKGNGLLDPNQNLEPWSSVLVCPTILQEDLVKIDRPMMEVIQREPGFYEADIDFFWKNVEPSIDGFECIRREPNSGAPWRIFEVNRNGCVQIARLVETYQEERKLHSTPIAIQLINTLNIASKLYEKVGYLGNVKIILGVNNIAEFQLEGNPSFIHAGQSALKGRSFLRVIRERYSGILSSQTEIVAKDIIDQFYNGFGRLESDLFRKDGKFFAQRF